MVNQLFLGILLTLLPITELRAGLPVIVDYAIKNGLPVWPLFLLVIFLNCIVIFFVFLFFDYIHELLLRWKFYSKVFEKYLKKIRKSVLKLKKRIDEIGYLALMIFVAVPLPGTGAWTGTVIAWTLNLNRTKSIIAISLGVLIAGLIILLATLGVFSLF